MGQFDFLKNEKWHFIHVRRRTPFFVHFWTYGLARPKKDIGFDYSIRHVGHLNHKVILDKRSYDRQRAELLSRLEKDPHVLKKLMTDYYELFENDTLKAWQRIFSENDLEKAPNSKLVMLLEEYFQAMARQDPYLLLPLYVESDLSDRISESLKRRFGEEKAQTCFDAVMMPVKDGILVDEKRSILGIALKLKKGRDFSREMKKHVEEFSWMPNQLYTMDFYDEAYYETRAKELAKGDPEAELKKLEQARLKVREEYEKAVEAVKDERRLLALFETAQEAIFFRNFRAEKLYQSSYYVRGLLREIAGHLGVGEREVVYLTAFEMIDLLKRNKKADSMLLAERKEGFALLTNVNDGKPVCGKELEELAESVALEADDSSEIKGQKAYAGRAKGTVCIVMKLHDLKHVQAGCVLVSPSTTPAYVPVLDRVAAIVTDEGGILCHAAVISRELKIPCITGTKIATKVLHDGDVVEVDSANGTARKL